MTKRTRILHCLPWLSSGGVERRRLLLAQNLNPSVYEQAVVCLRAKPDLIERFEAAGVRVHQLGEPFGKATFLGCARFAREWSPDIVHGAVFEGVMMAAASAAVHRPARLIVEEIAYPIRRSWRGNLLFRLLCTQAAKCVAVSPAVLEYLQKLRVPRRKTALIVNGTSAPRLVGADERERAREALALPPDAVVIGSVGRLTDATKRFSDLLQAFSSVANGVPKAYLLIVGDGESRPELERLTAQLGIQERVRFAGYRADVAPMYSLMDVFCLLSARESFGLVFVEAMFCGLPVVATNVGGIPDIVVNDETGYLVAVGDPLAAGRALQRLVQEPSTRASLGKAGFARASANFGSERYVRDVRSLYVELGPAVTPSAR